MLVLSRKPGESIDIDGVITLKVVQVQGNRVRLGIDAPPSVGIKRAELLTEADLPSHEEAAAHVQAGTASAMAVA